MLTDSQEANDRRTSGAQSVSNSVGLTAPRPSPTGYASGVAPSAAGLATRACATSFVVCRAAATVVNGFEGCPGGCRLECGEDFQPPIAAANHRGTGGRRGGTQPRLVRRQRNRARHRRTAATVHRSRRQCAGTARVQAGARKALVRRSFARTSMATPTGAYRNARREHLPKSRRRNCSTRDSILN
jgi:hypothetical protein